MKSIVLLDDLTINQIAAGEVIEGPYSVVKEMVENSIDAGATRVDIEVKNGGKTFIRIADNGKGIDYDDMDIAFERHATSKIRRAEDLSSILTMGFRGEALASIASVADVTVTSQKNGCVQGYTYNVKGGKCGQIEECNSSSGTTFIVKDLFYNVPVRYKFLKNDSSELQKIKKILLRLALANLSVSIKLTQDGKTILKTSGSSKMQVAVYEIFGKEISQNLIDIDYTYNNLKIKGVIGNSRVEMPYKKNELFFVNNRSIENEILFSGAEQGFKGALKIGKFPFVVLNLEIPPQLIDMNIHPTKKEIKFQKEEDVFQLVYQSIKDGLLREEFLGMGQNRNSAEVKKEYVERQEKTLPTNYLVKRIQSAKEEKSAGISGFDFTGEKVESNFELKESAIEQNHANEKLDYKFIGIVFKTFIIIQIGEEVYFVDQHAAHERILYEQVKDSYTAGKKPETQMLIIPTILPLSRSEVELVKDNIDVFEKVGFQIEDFGNNTIKISGVPSIAYNLDSTTIFLDTLKELTSFSRTNKQEIENKFVATVACKAAVKAGMVLSFNEVDAMLQKLWKLPNPYTCPHGRPTTIKYSKDEILKMNK
jgi:DNA mismatch repair protein MutL